MLVNMSTFSHICLTMLVELKLKNFWTKLDDIQEVWQQKVDSQGPSSILYVKMARAAKKLRHWGQRKISNLRPRLQIANKIIFQLDVAQGNRPLLSQELRFRAGLKGQDLPDACLPSKDKRMAKGKNKVFKEGDANTYFFHMKAKAWVCDSTSWLSALSMNHDGHMARGYIDSVMGVPTRKTEWWIFKH